MNPNPHPRTGRPDPPTGTLTLRAGPLLARYEPASGFLRCIRLGEREALRGIYAAVRDHNWDTIPGTLIETRREILGNSFDIEFECRHRRGHIDFVWRGTLTGTADGLIRYSFEGEARSTFRRNRIGFCVLHPIRECAGAPARQFRVDGSRIECRFPRTIEPQIFGQANFHDLRGLAHEVEPGVWAEVLLEGEVFEMEDQRNWTDASFKTYGTPLASPFPVEIPAGTRLRQCVTLRLQGPPTPPPRPVIDAGSRPPVRIHPSTAHGSPLPLPRLGLGLASHGQALTPTQILRLRALGLAHLRVDLRLASPAWPNQWERAAREAAQLGVKLELALHLPHDGRADWPELHRRLQGRTMLVSRLLALRDGEAATTRETLAAVRHALPGRDLPVGAGSDAGFCELNRDQALGRCALAEADFLFWSLNPQVHAFDDRTLLENLEAQAATVQTARTWADGKPVVISPVTLRRRFNPVATGPEAAVAPGELPPQVDPRQAGWLGAAWTLGSLAGLASAGVEAITYYETTGWRGVLELDEGSPVPARFPSHPGGVFPLYHVFAEIAGFAGSAVLPIECSAPGSVAALGLQHESRRVLLVANLDDQPRSVEILGFPDLPFPRDLAIDSPQSLPRRPEEPPVPPRPPSTRLIELPPVGIATLRSGPE